MSPSTNIRTVLVLSGWKAAFKIKDEQPRTHSDEARSDDVVSGYPSRHISVETNVTNNDTIPYALELTTMSTLFDGDSIVKCKVDLSTAY